MRRALKVASSLGSAALILSGAAMAAGPIPFDNWSVQNGSILSADGSTPLGDQPCPEGFVCAAPMTDNGFFQREITRNSDGVRFFQTIVTDLGASGNPTSNTLSFADENYVRINPPGAQVVVSGLADRQQVADAPNGFATTARINVGWASEAGSPDVVITQDVSEPNAATVGEFTSHFDIATGGTAGTAINIDQNVELTQDPGSAAPEDREFQRFVLRDRVGISGLDAGGVQLTLPGGLSTTVQNSSEEGGDESAKVIWVGQVMPFTGQNFGFQSFTTDAGLDTEDTISFFSTNEPGTFNWQGNAAAEALFGSAPQ